jgi:hypothetical protein
MVAVVVTTDTALATHPIGAHTKPAMQHPPPTLAEHAVLPLPHAPTLPLQFSPLGQHPTLPASGAFATVKQVCPVTQQ